MKLPSIAKIRIPILLTLTIGEIAGLLHFFGQPNFVQFVVLSLEGILLTFPLLWANSLLRRGVDGFNIFIALLSGTSIILLSRLSFRMWNAGERVDTIAFAGTSLFMATVILFKMLRPHYGTVTKDALAFFGYFIMLLWASSSHIAMLWKVVAALPLIWFVWRVVFQIRSYRKSGNQLKAIADQGGRA